MKRPKLFEEFQATEQQVNTEQVQEQEVKPTEFLDKFGKDLTKIARENKLEPVIGRDDEIFKVLWILSRKNKNNPVIIGEPGVGKTAIVEGIAQRIATNECPESLQNKRIVYIDMGSLVAGASAQGEFEKRIKTLLQELEEHPEVILFIDEIHMMVNPSQAMDAANMFKPALARGDVRLIGATTYNEYRNSIEKDGALNRRFIPVNVEQPSEKDTINILMKIRHRFEEFHKVKYTDVAVEQCVKLSGRYITDRFFPDKAIDLMDESGARKRLLATRKVLPEVTELEKQLLGLAPQKMKAVEDQDFQKAIEIRGKEKEIKDKIAELLKDKGVDTIEINENDIYEIIALKTGIPTTKLTGDESAKLLEMDKELKMQVIGQDEAMTKLAKFIRRSRVGLKDPNRPSGVFLFLGPTGTGKTLTAKSLAKYIFGSENDIIRVDMSEYREKHNVARLMGSPPGYVGYNEGGQLTEKVRRKPYSIILLDEIEKAHPEVLNVFLQVFDEGHMTDGQGRKIDFKNTIIIMTSNIGATEVKNVVRPVGFGATTAKYEVNQKEVIKKALYKAFPPEFINRIDEIVIFSSLNKENVYKIIDLEMDKLSKKLQNLGYTITITDNVKEMLMKNGYDEQMGARPMKRAIQNYIEDPISDEILRKKITDKIEVDYNFETDKLIINGTPIVEKIKNGLNVKSFNKFKIFE